jgi:hypothetical protein
MRKLAITSALAAIVATSLVASPAGARTETRFDVYAIGVAIHRGPDGRISFRDRLVEPANHRERVGHDKVACRFLRRGTSHCRAVFVFRNGTVKANGLIGGRHPRLPVVGGTRAFNGAAGKVIVQNLKRRNSLISFDLVQ